jgi:hypothetical protein
VHGISPVHSADSTSPWRVIRQGSPLTRETSLDTVRRWADHMEAREDEAQQRNYTTETCTPLSTTWGRLQPARNSLNGAASSTPESSTRRRQLADWLEVWLRRMCPRAKRVLYIREDQEAFSQLLGCLRNFPTNLSTPRLPPSTNQGTSQKLFMYT